MSCIFDETNLKENHKKLQDAALTPKSPHYLHLEIRNPALHAEILFLRILPLLLERHFV